MAGQETLDLLIGVRIPVPEPELVRATAGPWSLFLLGMASFSSGLIYDACPVAVYVAGTGVSLIR